MNIIHAVRKRFGPRRFQAFGIGPGKSGTHSLAYIFQPVYRSAHEAEAREAITLLIQHRKGEATDDSLRGYVRDKDRRLRLEMDSAGCNAFLAPYLVESFPDARFIMTVRDCFSWTNSAINQTLNVPAPQGHWKEWRKLLFGEIRDDEFATEEQVFASRGLWPLERFYRLWSEFYRVALDAVPDDRLLVLRMTELDQSLDKIASFLGIRATTLNDKRAAAYQTPQNHGLLRDIDGEFATRKAEAVCGELMARFFPDRPCTIDEFLAPPGSPKADAGTSARRSA